MTNITIDLDKHRRMTEVTSVADAVVGPQIHLLVFDAAPESLDEHVIAPGALAVHADRNAVVGERAGEGRSGELRTLIGIEHLWFAVTSKSVLQCLDAECRIHSDRSRGHKGSYDLVSTDF